MLAFCGCLRNGGPKGTKPFDEMLKNEGTSSDIDNMRPKHSTDNKLFYQCYLMCFLPEAWLSGTYVFDNLSFNHRSIGRSKRTKCMKSLISKILKVFDTKALGKINWVSRPRGAPPLQIAILQLKTRVFTHNSAWWSLLSLYISTLGYCCIYNNYCCIWNKMHKLGKRWKVKAFDTKPLGSSIGINAKGPPGSYRDRKWVNPRKKWYKKELIRYK